MNIHEYQAKDLLRAYGVPVPRGALAADGKEAWALCEQFGGQAVIKAQVHCGGRGKAGGVKLASRPEEAEAIAQAMLGMKLVTKQTGEKGKIVHKIYVTEKVDVRKEYYLSLTNDAANARLCVIASGEGGTEIEETAARSPEKIVRAPVYPEIGLKDYTALEIAKKIGIPAENRKEFTRLLKQAYTLYVEKDCTLIEINPLVLTGSGTLCALDAKIAFDDNALPRHPDAAALRDELEEDPREVEAERYGLNYVALDGNIGCMVNGAGLAMATMDIIKHFGGEPANFLDVGGSASEEKVTAAFEILLRDEKVRVIFVNIFGGIMKCDVIAQGIVEASKKIGIRVPVVVRLEGTNVEIGKEILHKSGLSLISAEDMAQAARRCVTLAKAGEKQ